MDFKRLQSIKLSNYNRGAFCSGNSTRMQRGANKKVEKQRFGAADRVVVPGLWDGGKGRAGKGRAKAKQSRNQEKKQSTGSLGILVEFPTLLGVILYFESF